MTIIAAITTSVDGYITGPNDGPDKGLGEGGERLHYWVFGGPWSYDKEQRGEPTGEDAAYLNEVTAREGAVVIGRNMYEAAGHWGDKNPFGVPLFVVTHRPEEEPATGEFTFVGTFEEAIDRAKEAAGAKDVSIGGGANVIRQGLDAGIVDELHIIVAPVILGGGKQLFEDFTKSLDLENLGVRQSRVGDLHQVRGQAVSAAQIQRSTQTEPNGAREMIVSRRGTRRGRRDRGPGDEPERGLHAEGPSGRRDGTARDGLARPDATRRPRRVLDRVPPAEPRQLPGAREPDHVRDAALERRIEPEVVALRPDPEVPLGPFPVRSRAARRVPLSGPARVHVRVAGDHLG